MHFESSEIFAYIVKNDDTSSSEFDSKCSRQECENIKNRTTVYFPGKILCCKVDQLINTLGHFTLQDLKEMKKNEFKFLAEFTKNQGDQMKILPTYILIIFIIAIRNIF